MKENVEFNKGKANDSQLLTFFQGYDDQWRLTKLVSIRMLLQQREELKKELRSFYGSTFEEDEDTYVYNETTNGLIFNAISELLMYLEDFFVLLSYIRDDEEFIKKVVKYQAGRIGKKPKYVRDLSKDELIKAYMIPDRSYITSLKGDHSEKEINYLLTIYDNGVENILKYTETAIDFFNKYRFYYNQYKHGLTVALKPFSGKLSEEELKRRKHSLDGLPVCYANESIDKAFNNGSNRPFVIPDFTKDLQPGLNQLQENKNLLRYHFEELVDIDELIEVGKKVHMLIRTLIKNRVDYIVPEVNQANTVFLPYPKDGDDFVFAEVTLVPQDHPLSLDDFNINI